MNDIARDAVSVADIRDNGVHAAQTLPYYFAAAAGLVYAVGFLVEFTFMNSLGITDNLIEPFKAKYIYIGFLCLQYPASMILMLLCLLKLRRGITRNINGSSRTPSTEESIRLSVYGPSASLFAIFLTAFYLLIAFARHDALTTHTHTMMILLTLCALSPTAVLGAFFSLSGKLMKGLTADAAQRRSALTKRIEHVLTSTLERSSHERVEEVVRVFELNDTHPQPWFTSILARLFTTRRSTCLVGFLWALNSFATC